MHRRVTITTSVLLVGIGVWACGDDEADAPATTDAGADVSADVSRPPDPPKEAGPPRGKTAGTCGPTIGSSRFGDGAGSSLLSGEAEAASALAVDSTSSLFVTGWVREAPDGGGSSTPSLLLRKLDASRAIAWSKTFNAGGQGLFQSAFARGHAMALSGDGVVIAGGFAGTLSLGGGGAPIASAFPTNDGGGGGGGNDSGLGPCSTGVGDCFGDAFIARFDRVDGAHRFSVRFGGSDGDTARAVAIAPNGDVIVAGTFQGTVAFGATLLTSAGKGDIFVARLDGANGNALGAFAMGGADEDIATGVAVDSTGDVVVTGVFTKSITVAAGTTYTSTGVDGFVAKLSNAGVHRWSKTIGASRTGQLLAVAVDASRAVYVAGSFDGTMDFAGAKVQGVRRDEALVAKLDSDGNLVWSKQWTGDEEEIASSIALGADGAAVFVAGASNSLTGVDYGGGPIGGGLYQGPFFVELDAASGTHKCSRSYSGDKDPNLPPDGSVASVGANAHAIVAASATSFASAGSFAGQLDLGKGPMTSAGGGVDGYVVDFTR